jgi:hypothetical protein
MDGQADQRRLDLRLRTAERRELPARAMAARQWHAARRATLATVEPKVGDMTELNVNAADFCRDPQMRTGKVVAVTERAVVIRDLANPPNGFADEDYASLGVTFDTLAFPSDVLNFGSPTDIDANGRIILFFTHAVNDLGQNVLGYFFARDLLPKAGPLGSCPGSNVGELLYLPVPDNAQAASQIRSDVYATMAHELQHAINAGRRLYVNRDAAPAEELWLNEGLSHIAEDLAFFRTTGLGPGRNLGAALRNAPYQQAYTHFLLQNFTRYFRFTRFPDVQGPLGTRDDDDDGETRGAIWSFLRFAADQRHPGDQVSLWRSFIDANATGMENLKERFGPATSSLIRDWALSNYLDDLVVTDSRYAQPSWNLREVPGFSPPLSFQLAPQTSAGAGSKTITLLPLSSAFVRFAVPAGQEAHLNVTGVNNASLPRGVLLAIVRTK